MKKVILALAVVLTGLSSYGAEQCEEDRIGKWMLGDYIVKYWTCDIDAEVGGITLGFGPSYQLMAGEGKYSCEAYNVDDELVGCYREPVAFGMLGKGVGIGLAVVRSMKAESRGITLLDLEPENFMGFLRAGIGANAGVNVGDVSSNIQTTMSFSLANGINFDLTLYEMKGLIQAHAGAHITGFAMHELDYDGDTSVIVDTVEYFSGVLGKIFAKLRAEGSNIDRDVFPAKNVVVDRAEAKAKAKAEVETLTEETGKTYVTRGIRVYGDDEELEGQSMDDYIKRGLEKVRNTCMQKEVRAYASFNCEKSEDGETETCDFAYFRAICEQ